MYMAALRHQINIISIDQVDTGTVVTF